MIGIMKNVEFELATFPKKKFCMNIIVIDISPRYVMLLSRIWIVAVGVCMQLDMLCAMIPTNGNQVNLEREKRVPTIIKEVEDEEDRINFCDVHIDNFTICSFEYVRGC